MATGATEYAATRPVTVPPRRPKSISLWESTPTTSIADSRAAIANTLMGTKNGEKTPTAISLASGGMWARIGTAIRKALED